MKTKKIKKKLLLNKSTVVDLEMKKVKGGCDETHRLSCPTWDYTCKFICS
jgi:hypothetical protein